MPTSRDAPFGVGFLLAQLGAYAAATFGEAVSRLGITTLHVGLLRAVVLAPGRSQQALADQFGMVPSRLVVLLDELGDRGLVERRRDPADRRVHLVHPTAAGTELMAEVWKVGEDNDRALLAGLGAAERKALRDLLERLADARGLRPGVHPAYRGLRPQRAGRAGRE